MADKESPDTRPRLQAVEVGKREDQPAGGKPYNELRRQRYSSVGQCMRRAAARQAFMEDNPEYELIIRIE